MSVTESAPFEKHSAGSRRAAQKIAPYLRTARYRVYEYIRDHPGCSDQDITKDLSMNPKTVAPRRRELEEHSLIRPDGLTLSPKGAETCSWTTTGRPYPDPFPNTQFTAAKLRAERPAPDEFREAAEQVLVACDAMRANGTPFSDAAMRVFRWMSKQV